MSKSIKGTETEKNLLKAFAGESQARNRYTYFAGVARKAGLEQIANIFTETAENEREHAKVFFKYLEGGDVEITAAYPGRDDRGDQSQPRSRGGRREDGVERSLPQLREDGQGRGLPGGRGVLQSRSPKWRSSTKSGTASWPRTSEAGEVFKRPAPVKWHCTNCGYVHEGPEAPAVCPACKHPRAFYELLADRLIGRRKGQGR